MKSFEFYSTLTNYVKDNSIEAVVIGAMDGVSHDSIRYFVHNPKFKIAFVEPIRHYLDKLIHNFGINDRFWFINKCVSDSDSSREFVFFDPAKVESGEFSLGLGGLSTIYPPKNSMRGYVDDAAFVDSLKRESFECVTVKSLLEMIPFTNINYLQIDTEGHDWTILKQFNTTDIDFIKVEFYSLDEEERDALFNMFEINSYEYYLNVEDAYAVKKKVLEKYAA